MEKQILEKKQQIAKLMNELMDLEYEKFISSATRFSTKEVNWGTKRKPEIHKVKYKHWNEELFDEDLPKTPENAIIIERSSIAEIDGKRTIDGSKLYKYTADNFNLQ